MLGCAGITKIDMHQHFAAASRLTPAAIACIGGASISSAPGSSSTKKLTTLCVPQSQQQHLTNLAASSDIGSIGDQSIHRS
jgi:hypothetical protein